MPAKMIFQHRRPIDLYWIVQSSTSNGDWYSLALKALSHVHHFGNTCTIGYNLLWIKAQVSFHSPTLREAKMDDHIERHRNQDRNHHKDDHWIQQRTLSMKYFEPPLAIYNGKCPWLPPFLTFQALLPLVCHFAPWFQETGLLINDKTWWIQVLWWIVTL